MEVVNILLMLLIVFVALNVSYHLVMGASRVFSKHPFLALLSFFFLMPVFIVWSFYEAYLRFSEMEAAKEDD